LGLPRLARSLVIETFTDRQHAYARNLAHRFQFIPLLRASRQRMARLVPFQINSLIAVKPGILKNSSSDVKNWDVSFTPSTRPTKPTKLTPPCSQADKPLNFKAGENKGRRFGARLPSSSR